jgi:hypothetical protein
VPCSYVLANMFGISLSKHRPKTVYEVIAELWKSPDYNPVAPPSDCHADFQMATVCSYDDIAGLSPATPQRIEDIFTSMRRDLLLIMKRWEQSGQGGGGRDNSDDDDDGDKERHEEHREEGRALSADAAAGDRSLGSLSRRPARALQSRAAFLNSKTTIPPLFLGSRRYSSTASLVPTISQQWDRCIRCSLCRAKQSPTQTPSWTRR